MQTFKTSQNNATIHNLTNTIALAQVLPTRTQTLVHSTNTSGQFSNVQRLTNSGTLQQQRQVTAPRPVVIKKNCA